MSFFEIFSNFFSAFGNPPDTGWLSLSDQISCEPLFLFAVCGILGGVALAFFLGKQFPVFSKLLWIGAMGSTLLLEGVETIGTQIMWITFISGVAGFYFLGSPTRPERV